MKTIPTSELTNLNDVNEMDLDKKTSNCVKRQENYTDQSIFYLNHTNTEANCYAAFQDNGRTKNNYQHLLG